jgi:putative DNA-invertase from lambdoid prophage Rac
MTPFQNTAPRPTAAAYLRVSTAEQTCDSQRHDLAQLAAARGLDIVEVFEETASGAATHRQEYDRMREAAHQGRFNVLLVWAIDRLSRRGMVDALQAVIDLDRAGVEVVSYRESWLTMQGPVRELLVGVFGWVAAQERAQLVARTRAGMERARRQGIRVGRPRAHVNEHVARDMKRQGMSLRAIAKKLGCGASTLHRLLAEPPPAPEAAVSAAFQNRPVSG